MKAWLEITGAGLTLLGVILSVYGTYLLTKWYHPHSWGGFMLSVAKAVLREFIGDHEKTERYNRVAAMMAQMTPENKAESLHGIHWIFFGFVLQTFGAVLIMTDAVWLNVFANKP